MQTRWQSRFGGTIDNLGKRTSPSQDRMIEGVQTPQSDRLSFVRPSPGPAAWHSLACFSNLLFPCLACRTGSSGRGPSLLMSSYEDQEEFELSITSLQHLPDEGCRHPADWDCMGATRSSKASSGQAQ